MLFKNAVILNENFNWIKADLKRYVALTGERAGKSEGANLLGANMEGP